MSIGASSDRLYTYIHGQLNLKSKDNGAFCNTSLATSSKFCNCFLMHECITFVLKFRNEASLGAF